LVFLIGSLGAGFSSRLGGREEDDDDDARLDCLSRPCRTGEGAIADCVRASQAQVGRSIERAPTSPRDAFSARARAERPTSVGRTTETRSRKTRADAGRLPEMVGGAEALARARVPALEMPRALPRESDTGRRTRGGYRARAGVGVGALCAGAAAAHGALTTATTARTTLLAITTHTHTARASLSSDLRTPLISARERPFGTPPANHAATRAPADRRPFTERQRPPPCGARLPSCAASQVRRVVADKLGGWFCPPSCPHRSRGLPNPSSSSFSFPRPRSLAPRPPLVGVVQRHHRLITPPPGSVLVRRQAGLMRRREDDDDDEG
jgi:hypothetical protein